MTTFPATVSDSAEVPHAEEHAPRAGCTNCASATVGKYCADCGEKQPGHHDLAVGHFAHEVLHELAHVDGKLVHTLRMLLTKPGQLTVDHFGGRRSRQMGPVRLFIIAFALQALLFSLSPRTAMFDMAQIEEGRPEITRAITKLAARGNMPVQEMREKLGAKWNKIFKLLELVQIVLAALVLKALYRRRFFAEHLVFAAHFLAFMYLWMVITYPIRWEVGIYAGTGALVMRWAGGVVLTIYIALAMRRFYHRGETLPWVRALAGYGGILLTFVVLQAVIMSTAVYMVLKHA